MLLNLDAGVQRLGSVILHHGHALLNEDGTGVRSRVDEVHRDARDLAAVIERLSPAMDTGKRRQQRGMDVEDAVRKRGEQLRLDDTHEAREHDRVDAGVFKHLDAAVFRGTFQLGLPRRAVEILAGDVVLTRTIEDLRVGEVREHELDLRIERAGGDRVDDGLHVGSGSGPEDTQMKLSHDSLPQFLTSAEADCDLDSSPDCSCPHLTVKI